MLAPKEQPHEYLHWDKLRHLTPPQGMTRREWWITIKLSRFKHLQPLALIDKKGAAFRFAVPLMIQENLHQIDLGAGGLISLPEPIATPETRDRYLMRSLMEEAITSSQLEGAATTREVAKEMIRSGRPPRDLGERMILNNFTTMQEIRTLKNEPLSPELLFHLHRQITEGTMEKPSAAGRLRTAEETCFVGDDFGEVYHLPPPAGELPERIKKMCAFANGETPDFFVHPVVRAMILHFWLAYDHPFLDGNGRTARALFYWAMLRHDYWLFEFLSISSILRKAPARYARSFLYTETDDNDLTYFLVAQTEVIKQAITQLHRDLERRAGQLRELEHHLRALTLLNHRQSALIHHALEHPGFTYTIAGHQRSHRVAYQTARTDLLHLAEKGLLRQRQAGKKMTFSSPADLSERLLVLEKQNIAEE